MMSKKISYFFYIICCSKFFFGSPVLQARNLAFWKRVYDDDIKQFIKYGFDYKNIVTEETKIQNLREFLFRFRT